MSIVVAVALVAGCRWLPPLLPLVCSSSQHGIEKLTVGTANEPPGQLMLLLKFSLLLLPLLLQVNSATRFCFLLHCHGLVLQYAEIAHASRKLLHLLLLLLLLQLPVHRAVPSAVVRLFTMCLRRLARLRTEAMCEGPNAVTAIAAKCWQKTW